VKLVAVFWLINFEMASNKSFLLFDFRICLICILAKFPQNMLQVKTKLSLSGIHGIGLFADEFIPKGTVMWTYAPNLDRVYTEPELQALNKLEKNFVETYSFKYFGNYYLCVDDARFMNHSKTPNCTDEGVVEVADKDLGHTFAMRDISPGEELTCDYTFFGGTDSDLEFNLFGVS